jgi:type IV pilus assembly protein PilB
MALKLGELLLKAQLVTEEQLQKALDEQKSTGGKIGEILQKMGAVTEDDIIECLSHQFGVPSINLRHFEIDPAVAKVISQDLARKYNVIPVNKTGATLTLAMTDPTNIFAMDEITFMTGYRVEPVVASEEAIREMIDRHHGSTREVELKKVMDDLSTVDEAALELLEEEDELDVAKLVEGAEEAPVVRLVNIMMTDAIKRGASDIHVEPYEKSFRCRYRIDGLLREVMTPPLRLKDSSRSLPSSTSPRSACRKTAASD